MTLRVLGVSHGYHDAAAAVVVEGAVVAAAQEERFTRIKHDPSLPRHAVEWCLDAAGIAPGQLDAVVLYDKPFTTYERVLATHAEVGPRGVGQLTRAVSRWTRSQLWAGAAVDRMLEHLGHRNVPVRYSEHHLSHAAAAFFPSPFDEAAVLTVDGVGEWATTTFGTGRGAALSLDSQVNFPDSLGLLYSTATAYLGFEVNDGEYKVMGLAPYGEPVFVDVLRAHVVDVHDDGSFRLDQRYFDYRAGSRMASPRLWDLLGGPPRTADQPLEGRHADVARSFQVVLEDVLLGLARHVHERTGLSNLCLGGGVALNCVANQRLLVDGPFDDLWVQPAAGDAGSAVGAALWFTHAVAGHVRTPGGADGRTDGMSGVALGPSFEPAAVGAWLDDLGVAHEVVPDLRDRCARVAAALADGAVVGWFTGPMEFGPRALGHRSILADPRAASMVGRINQMVKGREGFRPFAPAVAAAAAGEWFDLDRPSPYMLRTVPVRSFRPAPSSGSSFTERLASVASDLPACTHVDGSARVQTVAAADHEAFSVLLDEFERLTGCPVLLNTSFNRADEPVVRTPADALRCATAAGLDLLVLEDRLVHRTALAALSATTAPSRSTPADP